MAPEDGIPEAWRYKDEREIFALVAEALYGPNWRREPSIAKALGVSQPQLYRIVQGTRTWPVNTLSRLMRWAWEEAPRMMERHAQQRRLLDQAREAFFELAADYQRRGQTVMPYSPEDRRR